MFIVMEGGDGTGKTTLTNRLAQLLGGRAYATPPERYRSCREKVDLSATPDEHYDFYRKAVIDASGEIKALMEDGDEHVFCDRYWISTVTYHEAMGLSVDHNDFESVHRPDLTVMLVVSPDEQIRRMVKRGMSAGDKRMLDQQQKLNFLFLQNLVNTNSPFICIDTGRFSPDECVQIIRSTMS